MAGNFDDTPNVGERIRELRKQRGLALRALASECGLSANAISLIERGETSPTVSSLNQLAKALNVPITDFFKKETVLNAVLVRKQNGLRFENEEIVMESLGIGLPHQELEPFRITLKPKSEAVPTPITHPGHEFMYCLEGEIEYYVAGHQYTLTEGDSLLIDATQPHCWCNKSNKKAIVILVFQASHGRHLARQRHLEIDEDYESNKEQ